MEQSHGSWEGHQVSQWSSSTTTWMEILPRGSIDHMWSGSGSCKCGSCRLPRTWRVGKQHFSFSLHWAVKRRNLKIVTSNKWTLPLALSTFRSSWKPVFKPNWFMRSGSCCQTMRQLWDRMVNQLGHTQTGTEELSVHLLQLVWMSRACTTKKRGATDFWREPGWVQRTRDLPWLARATASTSLPFWNPCVCHFLNINHLLRCSERMGI